jgi:EAL and modified HD-GYP domain-containing signal transduction protein
MPSSAFLTRTPLLTRDGKFGAYRLGALGPASPETYAPVLRAPPVASVPLLMEDFPEVAPSGGHDPKRFFVIVPATETPQRVAALKQCGLSICARLEDPSDATSACVSLADHVWLVRQAEGGIAAAAKATLRVPGRRIAGGIADRDAFEEAKDLGTHLFEGDWYLAVRQAGARAVAPGQAVILDLMRLTQAEAPVGKIEETLKRDATISFRLLRYINSAGFGLSCEIQSFRHAVTILGYQNLGRWLALLLASAGSTPAAPALMREAIVRARLGELIGLDLFEPHDRDNLFIVGVFSLLPPILQVPMPALLDQLNLAESLSDALLNRAGLYGPVLRLVEAVEGRDADDIHALALSLNLSAEQLNAHHLEALSWADRVTL